MYYGWIGCDTPGKKIRSGGMGRGLARGGGMGPIGGMGRGLGMGGGRGLGLGLRRGGGAGRWGYIDNICATPGKKIRSGGMGRGLGIGGGRGPIGIPKGS